MISYNKIKKENKWKFLILQFFPLFSKKSYKKLYNK